MSGSIEIFQFEHVDGTLVVTPTGSMVQVRDGEIRDAYNETYRLLCLPDVSNLLIDFEKLDYFGSTFIGMLIRLAKKARADGGEAFLCCLSSTMRDMMKNLMLLENTKTDFFWTPFETREEALAALDSKEPGTEA
ncbi:MAG: STAS domain-containing protein [Fuerstiella sp.]